MDSKKKNSKKDGNEGEYLVLVHTQKEADLQAAKWRRSDLRYEDRYLQKIYEAYIECTRNLRYCHSLLKPTDFQVTQGIGKTPYFEDGVVELVSRWRRSYDLCVDYPVRKPIDEEVKACIVTRPPTPVNANSLLPKILDRKQEHQEKGNGDIKQDTALDAIVEKKEIISNKNVHKSSSDDDENSYVAPRRTRHHFSSDDDSDTEEEEEDELNQMHITPQKLAREAWRKGKIRHPEPHQLSPESTSPINLTKEFRGQGFAIPRIGKDGSKIKRVSMKELEESAQEQVRIAKQVAARQAKFKIRGVRNLVDTDSSSGEDQSDDE